MLWLETDPMHQRLRFLKDLRFARLSMTEICAHFQISRKSGDKWIDREAEEGRRGVADRSRAPHHCPHTISDEMATLLCEFRIQHDDWGARKVLRVLQGRHPRPRSVSMDCRGRSERTTARRSRPRASTDSRN